MSPRRDKPPLTSTYDTANPAKPNQTLLVQ